MLHVVPRDKESRWQFVDDATEAALSKELVPKNTATSRVELCCLEKWVKCSRSNP